GAGAPRSFAPSQCYFQTSSQPAKIFQRRGREGLRRGTQRKAFFATLARTSASFGLNRAPPEFGCGFAALRLCGSIRVTPRNFALALRLEQADSKRSEMASMTNQSSC